MKIVWHMEDAGMQLEDFWNVQVDFVVSRGTETVKNVNEDCSRAGSHLSGRTVLLKANSQDVQQAHGAIILYIL